MHMLCLNKILCESNNYKAEAILQYREVFEFQYCLFCWCTFDIMQSKSARRPLII